MKERVLRIIELLQGLAVRTLPIGGAVVCVFTNGFKSLFAKVLSKSKKLSSGNAAEIYQENE